jgi:uncharacterized GH25 family protein
MKKLLLFALLLTAAQQLFAHALWIETEAVGKKGKQHEARVFFGEYGSNERDTTAKWFSNLREFQLFLTAPSGKKLPLATVANTDYFSAVFVPEENGVYTLSVTIEVKDLHRKSKIYYYCDAAVLVGSSATGSNNLAAATDLSLVFQPLTNAATVNTPIKGIVYLNGKPLSNSKVTFALSSGKKKDLETNAEGAVVFTADEKGLYMVEAFNIIKETGTHNGKEYNVIYHCVTRCLDVR